MKHNTPYATKKIALTLFSLCLITGFLKAAKQDLLTQPREIQREFVKQLIETTQSFEEAAQWVQAVAATNRQLRELLTKDKDYRRFILDSLLKKFEIITPQIAQEKLFELAQSGNGTGLAMAALNQAGADVNEPSNGDTALILAASNGHKEMVQLLIDAGAKVNKQNITRDTALIEASRRGYPDIVQLLLKAKANPNQEDLHGETALIWASNNGHTSVVQQLINAGADPNKKNYINGKTALMEAAGKGHRDSVQLLLNAGADVYQRDNAGKIALFFAGNPNIRKLLEEAAQKKFLVLIPLNAQKGVDRFYIKQPQDITLRDQELFNIKNELNEDVKVEVKNRNTGAVYFTGTIPANHLGVVDLLGNKWGEDPVTLTIKNMVRNIKPSRLNPNKKHIKIGIENRRLNIYFRKKGNQDYFKKDNIVR